MKKKEESEDGDELDDDLPIEDVPMVEEDEWDEDDFDDDFDDDFEEELEDDDDAGDDGEIGDEGDDDDADSAGDRFYNRSSGRGDRTINPFAAFTCRFAAKLFRR